MSFSTPPDSLHARRDGLWELAGVSAVCKVSILPGDGSTLCHALKSLVPGGQSWDLCMQGAGTGWLRVAASGPAALAATLRTTRRKLELLRGSLLVLRCPPEVRREVDAWGDATDALFLMRRIKQQFDPKGTLNPGRFIGGI
jgi:glycolate oxidase FAD binding subunit